MDGQFISCVPSTIKVQSMVLRNNLVEVDISEQQLKNANFTDGIQIQVRSARPFTVNAYWIVKNLELHEAIEGDWKTLRDALWDNKLLIEEKASLKQNKPMIYHQSYEPVQCTIQPPEPIDTSNMTTTPRDFYPLVIIVTCHEEEPNPQASDLAATILLIHIKDSIVPLDSHIVKRYQKQVDGTILDMTKREIYQEDSLACFICFEEADAAKGLSLFCLQPCKHSPICSNCITRIRDCPKCRSPIASVFDIYAAPADTSSTSQPRPTIDPSLRHLYDDSDEVAGGGARRQPGGVLGFVKSLFRF